MTDALGRVAADYEARTGQVVRLSFAASGVAAHQIQNGAPADVVILADPVWMDRLQAADAVAADSRVDLLSNSLVVIAASDAQVIGDPFAWLRATDGRLAVGDPGSVPAGAYARTWLTKRGLWDGLQTRIVTAADVRAVRTFVQRGEAALGVVYKSDIVDAPSVRVVLEPPPSEQPPILYPAARVREAGAGADAFLTYLRGPEATAVFVRHGFRRAP